MRRRVAAGMVWTVLVIIPIGWACGHITVEHSSDSRIDLLIEIPAMTDVTDDEGRWIGVEIPGFARMHHDSLRVAVPATAYLVAIPPDVEVSCEVYDATFYEIDSYALGNVLSGPKVSDVDLPVRPVEITVDGYFKHQRVAGLRISPVVRAERGSAVRVYTRFRASIRFDTPRDSRRTPPAGGTSDGASEAAYKAALLNYEQGKLWRRPGVRRLQTGDYYSNSPDWIMVKVESAAVYCITGRDLEEIGVSISSIEPGTLRMYAGDGLPLKESLADSNAIWMRSVPVTVCDGGDGRFDRGDSVIFYGLGARGWADLYDSDKPDAVYYKSFFSTYNCYWLTWGGTFSTEPKRMEEVDLPVCNGCTYYQPESFLERIHAEKDAFDNFSIRADDGWYWQRLRTNVTSRFSISTPSPDTDRKAAVKIRVSDWYDLSVSDRCKYSYYRVMLYVNDAAVQDTIWRASSSSRNVVDITSGGVWFADSETQDIDIEPPTVLPPPDDTAHVCDQLYLAWIDVHYWRDFTARENRMFFGAPDTTCTVRYAVGGFTSPPLYVFDVTDQFDVKRLRGADVSTGPTFSIAFFDTVRQGVKRRYAILSPGAVEKPAEITRRQLDNIRYQPGAEYCVVTHEDLLESADRIASLRSGEVVTTRQIYDEFGWGVPDVTAIRDFLRWRYRYGPLEWVLLLGDASWDYRGYRTGDPYPNYVPSYERRYLLPFGSPYNTDDWFAYLEPVRNDSVADYPTVGISRLPASSPEEAVLLVSKTCDYVSNPEFGPWQNKVILVADDDHIPRGCEPGSPHTNNVEELSDEAYPPVFERKKIYLTEYPMESTGLKPEARNDFVRYLNEGALMTNFVGHGDPFRLAQEEVCNPSTIELIRTGRRETFFIAASCNVSRFDEPSFSSMAENLLKRPGGGSIGSLASTYLGFPGPNQALNLNFIKALFPEGDKDPTIPIADAVMIGKWQTVVNAGDRFSYWKNDEVYALFGDPALELAVPRLDVVFEATVPETLLRKSPYEFTASILDTAGIGDWTGGQAQVYLHEAEDTTGYQSCDPDNFFDYELPGTQIFRGTSEISDGEFRSRFFVSAGAREGAGASLLCFATNTHESACGFVGGLVVSGEAHSEDTTGPEIEITRDGQIIQSGDTLEVGTRLDINLTDDSGVAIKGKSAFIPSVSIAYDDVERIDLADSVFAIDGDFTQSVVSFNVPYLPAGEHKLSVAAFDNLNNLTTKDYSVHIALPAGDIANVVYAYPNPAYDVCYIIWEYENDRYVNVEATIYTVSGRKVWSGVVSGQSSYHQIVWDGTDMAGDRVANGTYLVVVEAADPFESGFSTSDKIVISLLR